MRRGASGLCGVLAIDKPAGMTSHDIVDFVRRITGERRVGHAGTLDPSATGLMLVCVGPATRLCTYLSGHDKTYVARFVFGAATDTDDAQGRVIDNSTADLEDRLGHLASLDPVLTLEGLVGETDQIPPAFCAIKKSGVVAYRAAREGSALDLEPRRVCIYSAQFISQGVSAVDLACMDGTRVRAKLPWWEVALKVSKGTYIRSIARDLGLQLGCGAHVGGLRRTRIGACSLDEASTLDELKADEKSQDSWPWCDPARILGFQVLDLDDQQAKDVSCGRSLSSADAAAAAGAAADAGADAAADAGAAAAEGQLVSCVYDGRLLAVYERSEGCLRPKTVIPGGVCGVC